MCGLVSKLKFPEFINLINQFDIVGIQESKTDNTDVINIPGYSVFSHNRARISRFRSGGIILIVKNDIPPFIKIDQVRNSKLVLLFTISRHLCRLEDDIQCGTVYVPPYGSKYVADDPYLELQSELLRYCSESKHILLFGDFNARTRTLPDCMKFDEKICEVNKLNDLLDESTELFDKMKLYNVPVERSNADNTVNTYGRQLLEMCKNNNLLILNGRIGQDNIEPKVTCKDRSTVDYFLSTVDNFKIINNLITHEFCDLYSDAHCALSLTLSIDALININKKHNNTKNTPDSKVKAWDSRKADNFIENFDVIKAAEIETQMDNLLNNGNISKSNVNEIIDNIGNLFKSCSKETFGEVKSNPSDTYDKVKPWFNSECFRTRNLYHKCRKMYNRYKTNYYKNIFKFVSKKYKTTLSKTHKTYKANKIKDIRNLKINDPRKYWKLINSQSKNNSNNLASLDDLYNFFKTSNTQTSDSHDKDFNDSNLLNNENNEEINQIISENEILQAVKTLKNNKSPGVDDIVNEQIKTTVSYMLPIYVKLFNMIFDTGIILENWTIGNIKPIYKNKGDPKQPENYRPITLVSCFGKLFTSVINSRLTKYAESHDLITSSQAGFRKHYSTIDNLFIVKSLIDIVRSSKKKLYCCFVDFKQAFDTVWREGLGQNYY